MFTINGVQYKRIVKEYKKVDPKVIELMAIADAYGGGCISRLLPKVPNCDILEEYGLIERKESKLSSVDRKAVVRIFKSKFEAVVVSKMEIPIDNKVG